MKVTDWPEEEEEAAQEGCCRLEGPAEPRSPCSQEAAGAEREEMSRENGSFSQV